MRVLVTGASGVAGGATVRGLNALGVAPVALTRSGRVPTGCNVSEVRRADFANPGDLSEAFADVDRVLLCSSHHPEMETLQGAAVRAAVAAGVRRIVKISGSPASVFDGTPAGVAAAHRAVERLMADSGLEGVAVRPNAFMSSLFGVLRQAADRDGRLALPLGDARISFVAPHDIGAVAAALLVAEGRPRPVIEVTGPEALSFGEAASDFNQATGANVTFTDCSLTDARQRLLAAGMSVWLVDHTLETLMLLGERDGDRVTSEVPEITGAPATTWSSYLTGGASCNI